MLILLFIYIAGSFIAWDLGWIFELGSYSAEVRLVLCLFFLSLLPIEVEMWKGIRKIVRS